MKDPKVIARFPSGATSGQSPAGLITPYDIKRFLKRYARTIVTSLLLGLLVATVYAWSAVPMYTARTQLIIDPYLPQIPRDANSEVSTTIDNAQIESQLEILRSDKIAFAVIKSQKLEEIPEFINPRTSLLGLPSSAPQGEHTRKRAALSRFQSNLSVRRVGLSYAIEIRYRAQSPELAAGVANATAEAYIQEQFSARSQAAQRSNEWLEQRIDQLRVQMNDAALKVQEFRAKRDYRIAPIRNDEHQSQEGLGNAKTAAAHRQNTIEELDSTAQTYRRIYESYLKAYAESDQKHSYPVAIARVITEATSWIGKSHPKTELILALGGLMGGLVGFGIAFFRHSIDRSVSSANQIRDEIGVECLASIPLLATAPLTSMALFRRSTIGRLSKWRSGAPRGRLFGLIARLSAKLAVLEAEFLASGTDNENFSASVTLPFCGFSHGIKTWKTAIALASRAKPIRSIAVTSALPGEGKTTLCANLAELYAATGVRVLLVDGDLRTRRLSRVLAPDANLGIVEVIEGRADLDKCILPMKDPYLSLLPVAGSATPHSEALLGSKHAQALIKLALNEYDLVIIELSPLVASVDSLAMSALLDTTVIVAEWGKTPLPLLAEAVHLLRNAHAKILGIVLNKADTSTVRYGDVGANYIAYSQPSQPQLSQRA